MKFVPQYRIARHALKVPRLVPFLEFFVGLFVIVGVQGMLGVFVNAAPDVTPPSIPANLVVTGRSATGIDISWDASTDDVGVAGYTVYRNGTQIATPTATSFSDSGLTPNTGYTYTVSAYDAASNASSQSGPLSTSTLADTSPPSTPTNIRQTSSTVSTISIAWNASSDNVGVTSYEIYRNGSLVRTQATTAYTDTGLAVYTTYTYNIIARDASGNSSNLSATLYGGTSADTTAPSVPDNLHSTGSTVSSVTLAWNASTDDVGVSGYHIYRDGNLVATTAATTYTDTGLTVSTNYTYTISAYDAANNTSLQSAPYNTSSSNDTTAPTIPGNVHTTAVYDTSVAIAWNASTDDVAVTGYKVYRGGSLVATTTGTSYTDTNLTPVTDYVYTVKAYDAANNQSASSAGLNVQTAYDTTAPTVPSNLHSTGQTDTSVTLAWDPSTDNVAVSGYDIYRDGTLISTTASTSYTDSGLQVNTAYSYRIRAHDAYANNSAQTAAVAVQTLTDQIAPSTPANLISTGQTTTSIDLAWDAATDDVAVTGYKLYRDGVLIATLTTTNYHDSGLHYNRSYSYTVTAHDNAGNDSASSLALAVSTNPDTTAPTVALTAPINGQGVQLTIGISATASDDLELNRVEFFVDGTWITTITAAPFAFNWDTYNVHNGNHQITAKAIDASGNATSQGVIISVNNPPPPLKGDLNGDHRINIYDLSILLSHYNRAGAGDFNNNGRVDIFDLSVLLGQYGKDNSNYS